jgi:hypothetical protein
VLRPNGQIRFLGGKLGHIIAEKFEVETVGDLLYACITPHCHRLLNSGYDAQVHQSAYVGLSILPVNSSFTYNFSDEIQQKLGEDTIWVYEILRYG